MLDNPIWSSLTTGHARFALADGPARRFAPDVAPFLGIRDPGPESVAAMARLAEPGERITMVGVVPDEAPGWSVEKRAAVAQMVFEGNEPVEEDDPAILVLGAGDVPDMLALTGLVYPEYFRPRTHELGTYLGVRREGRLIAMAGRRMWPGHFREISAVCTHPDFRGQGLARRLLARLVTEILRDGLSPFLHVDAGNAGARAAYERAGFVVRRDLPLVRLRRESP
ncbi:Mycothiol acetyltransferase [Aquisphaera giovannonii]|uniref:Mycothiol acetyltransferase n=1 Tax=Aquisphaera giovannonii TaxID=406548 RepID=A0A5B9WBC3_9BACT|nr:GNAT family N-acetyltransferase [Aquisphaera giovannonii]QEH37569.1 Mycothiol acetyltransferase [Aquisphaera giovannonii]